MAKQKKKYRIVGIVEVEVYAEVEAVSERGARQIFNATDGSGVPDQFSYTEGSWVSSVQLDRIEEIK